MYARLGVVVLYIACCFFVKEATSQAGGCAVPTLEGISTNATIYRDKSSALQLFMDAAIPCSGNLVSWNFVSRVPVVNTLHLSVWRMVAAADASNNPSVTSFVYRMIGETVINGFGARIDAWNSYSAFQPFPVQAGDVIGIFYDNWMTDQRQVPIPQADRFTTFPSEASQLMFYRAYISLLSANDIYAADRIVSFANSTRDLRLPALQAVVSTDGSITRPPPPSPTGGLPTDGSKRCLSKVTAETFSCGYRYLRAIFNHVTRSCQTIQGCLPVSPTANNFATLEDCSYWCSGFPTQPPSPGPGPGGFQPAPRCLVKPVRDVDFNNCPGAKTTRYYFNAATMQCVGFLGCDNPNPASNNFALKVVCMDQCMGGSGGPAPPPPTMPPTAPPSSTDRCNLRPLRNVDFGACGFPNNLVRYYYSPQNRQCVAFQGCLNPQGGNNFESNDACFLTCTGSPAPVPPTLPPATPMPTVAPTDRCAMRPIRGIDFGACPGGAATLVRYYYNVNTGGCVAFQGCVNPNPSNNFGTLVDCQRSCGLGQGPAPAPAPAPSSNARCAINPIRGADFGNCPGDNTIVRYYWSRGTLSCVGFQGCINMNGNNWGTREECLANCGTQVGTMSAPVAPAPAPMAALSSPDRCKSNPVRDTDFGNCPGEKSTRWYFTPATQACTAFSGCNQATGNNFPSRASCGTICTSVPEATRAARCRANPATQLYECDESKRVGNRTWFDVSTRQCTTFKYQVCPVGDGNNFDNVDDCTSFCNSLM